MRTRCYPTHNGRWWRRISRLPSPVVVHAQRKYVPSSTPSSICSALAANGGSFQTTSRLGRPRTGTSGAGVWLVSGCCCIARCIPLARLTADRKPGPTLAIMDGQSVGTTERGGVHGFDGHKRVKGRKRHILVDILGLPITNRVEPANMSDRRAGSRMLAGVASLWPTTRTIIAGVGHESRKLARQLRRDGWNLLIVKRKQRSFKVAGLTWIVERSFAWLGFDRRLSKDYECYVQTSETLLEIAAIRLMLNLPLQNELLTRSLSLH